MDTVMAVKQTGHPEIYGTGYVKYLSPRSGDKHKNLEKVKLIDIAKVQENLEVGESYILLARLGKKVLEWTSREGYRTITLNG